MLIKFNGELVKERSYYGGGCSQCGTARSISGEEVHKTTYRTYYANKLYIFTKGQPVEVDSILGKFLLTKKYTDVNGVVKNSFEEVVDT